MPHLDALPAATLAACVALLATVVMLWLPPRWLWLAGLVIVAATAGASGIVEGPAWLALVLLAALMLRYRRAVDPLPRALYAAGVAIVSLLLALHLVPGFHNPVVLRDVQLAADARPYTQFVNFDKGLGAVMLLGAGGFAGLRSAAGWRAALAGASPVVLGTLAVALAGSFALGYVRFEPRWTPLVCTWAPINLLLTCVAEETFFRHFLQREMIRALGDRAHAAAIGIAATAVLFGVAHAAGGWRYVVLATLAGTGYGLAFHRTGRLEMAILTHFAVNATHFLLFTYPALA
jgi:membrane protease YdiL (CAAX protease family)